MIGFDLQTQVKTLRGLAFTLEVGNTFRRGIRAFGIGLVEFPL